MKSILLLTILFFVALYGQNKYTLSQSEFIPAAGFLQSQNYTSEVKYGVNDFGVMRGEYFTVGPSTQVEKQNRPIPTVFGLEQNYPNPFNQTTTLIYHLSQPGPVYVAVYSILGQEVAVLLNGYLQAGSYQSRYNGSDQQGMALASGVYLLRMHSSGLTKTIKLAILR
jgi:hypothetical protein